MRLVVAASLAATFTVALSGTGRPKFYDDDPVWVYADTQDASRAQPQRIELFVDLAYNLFFKPGDQTPNVRAKDLNTVDQVPDSSWFTNRAGSTALTADEIATGPNRTSGPAPGPWTITSSKSDGVTPGFTVLDANRERWFLKVDPSGFHAMATGPEVVVTKLMWALGYHVPENHIAVLHPDWLVIGEGAGYQGADGKRRPMRPDDIKALLARAHRERDGTYRVIAARALEGTPLGGFRFYDTRPDDPNDTVPHEHRRELRALGVFFAWVNLVDAKAGNMLDTLVHDNGRSYVRHHVQDLGSTLGSGARDRAEYWEGHEYLLEPRETVKQMISFGFHLPAWKRTALYEKKPVGRFPADNTRFDPDAWKPRFPNQAFLHARADDKFWAAQKVLALTDDLIRAAVRTGQFGDERAEVFLAHALQERRDAIARKYLTAINPIDDPVLDEGGGLTFRNAAVDAGFAQPPATYTAAWFSFDNNTWRSEKIGENTAPGPRFDAPGQLPYSPGAHVKVELSVGDSAHPSWSKPVHVYFRRQSDGWHLVGFERQPEE